jgi:hypothetical protein
LPIKKCNSERRTIFGGGWLFFKKSELPQKTINDIKECQDELFELLGEIENGNNDINSTHCN